MMLIVGLGNPGEKYRLTPHNLGFMTIDRIAENEGVRVVRPEDDAVVGKGEIAARPVVLAKPLAFMNRSGGSVARLLERYEIEPERMLVIYDDLDLPWGALRLRERGSSGGHRGVESIIGSLQTYKFPRLRLGINPGREVGDGARFVLRRFRSAELDEAERIVGRAAEAVRLFISEGAAQAMAVVNRRAGGQTKEEE